MPKPKESESIKEQREKRAAQEMEFDLWREPDSKAVFTFKLRPRLIQVGIGCKLLCCVAGKPVPKVQWFKNSNPISDNDPHYQIDYGCNVCTLEISSCSLNDAGVYRCRAENPLGSDETQCNLNVEGIHPTQLININS